MPRGGRPHGEPGAGVRAAGRGPRPAPVPVRSRRPSQPQPVPVRTPRRAIRRVPDRPAGDRGIGGSGIGGSGGRGGGRRRVERTGGRCAAQVAGGIIVAAPETRDGRRSLAGAAPPVPDAHQIPRVVIDSAVRGSADGLHVLRLPMRANPMTANPQSAATPPATTLLTTICAVSGAPLITHCETITQAPSSGAVQPSRCVRS